MDKQREEFLAWHQREFNYHPDDITITEELRQLAWQRELGWQAAQTAMQPEIDRLTRQSANRLIGLCKCGDELEQSRKRVVELEERIRVADAEEPVLWMFTVDGRYYTAKSKAHADSMLNHPDTHLYPDKPEDFPLSPLYLHAQIPAEVAPSSDIVPDRYCKQSKCANATTGCVGYCKLDELSKGLSVTMIATLTEA